MAATVAAELPLPTRVAPSPRSSVWPWLTAAAFVPLLTAYYVRLWELPHYQFFPLALGGAYLLVRRDRAATASSSAEERAAGRRAAKPLLFVALVVLAAAVVLDSPWLAVPGALFAAGAYAVDRGGRGELRRLFPAALMVLVTLRPPMGFDDRLIRLLQQITARSASAVLDVLGVLHVLSGNVIEIPGRRLMVEEACSGVNSFFSATACVLFYVLWNRRGWFNSLLLFLSIPFWVVFANTLRVVGVTVLRSRWNIAADEGWLHDALGLGVFLLAVGLIVSTERFLRFYAALLKTDVVPPPNGAARPSSELSAAEEEHAASRDHKWKIAGVVAILLLLLQAPGVYGRVSEAAAEMRAAPLASFGETFVAEQLGPWRRVKYETIERDRNSPFGRMSQSWLLTATGAKGVLSLDYPFAGWHELTECYEAQGWRVERREVIANPVNPAETIVRVSFHHDQSGRYGGLWFALLTPSGEPYAARTRGEFDEWRDRAERRVRDLLSFRLASDAVELKRQTTYQAQFFVESYVAPEESQISAARDAFTAFYRATSEHLRAEAVK